jgi:hypothetical protein
MSREELDALVARIDSLIDEGRPTESRDSVALGMVTYDGAQQISPKALGDDTP